MGTSWRATAVAGPDLDTAALAAAIHRDFEAVCDALSTWRPASEISRFNRAPAGSRVPVSGLFAAVLGRALEIAALTGGAFDPTVGGWRQGHDRIGRWRDVELDRRNRTATQPGGLVLELSAIAKGHAVDRLSARLAEAGAVSHLAEIGGEFVGRGVKPDRRPWWVALERLGSGRDGDPQTLVALSDAALATSGYRTRTGRPLGELIDPRSGRPYAGDTLAVSVLTGCCGDADAFATGLLVMGPEKGMAAADAHGLAARFLIRTRQGVEARLSRAMAAMDGPS